MHPPSAHLKHVLEHDFRRAPLPPPPIILPTPLQQTQLIKSTSADLVQLVQLWAWRSISPTHPLHPPVPGGLGAPAKASQLLAHSPSGKAAGGQEDAKWVGGSTVGVVEGCQPYMHTPCSCLRGL